MSYLQNAGFYLISVLFGIVVVLFLLRVIMQLGRVNYYNPVAQMILKLTNPILMPISKIIPRWGRLDLSALMIAWLVNTLKYFLITPIQAPAILAIGLVTLLDMAILILMVALFIQVIFSWISPRQQHPVQVVAQQLCQPIIAPLQRIIPSFGGLDFSVLAAMLALQLARMLIVAPLLDTAVRL